MTSGTSDATASAALTAVWLNARDDVATALRALAPGEPIEVRHGAQARVLEAGEAIPLGHKIALRAMERGTRVRKYGEYIGRLSADVAAGGWVHTHNLATAARRTTGEELAWRGQAAPAGGTRAVSHGDAPPAVPARSRDGRTLYVAQPAHGYVLAQSADGTSRVFADLGGLPGEPVAVAVDKDDHVWVALADAGALLRYAPDGTLVRVLRVPATHPVSIAFGPAGSHDLYVASRTEAAAVTGSSTVRPQRDGSAVLVLDAGVGRLLLPTGASA